MGEKVRSGFRIDMVARRANASSWWPSVPSGNRTVINEMNPAESYAFGCDGPLPRQRSIGQVSDSL